MPKSNSKRRGVAEIEVSDFFGLFRNCRKAGRTAIKNRNTSAPTGATGIYLKRAISPEDLAIASLSVIVIPDGKRGGIETCVSVWAGLRRYRSGRAKAEKVLAGADLNEAAIREAAEVAASEAEPMTDPHGSADYRRKMVKVLVRRLLSAVLDSQRGSGNGKAYF